MSQWHNFYYVESSSVFVDDDIFVLLKTGLFMKCTVLLFLIVWRCRDVFALTILPLMIGIISTAPMASVAKANEIVSCGVTLLDPISMYHNYPKKVVILL